MLRRRMWIKLKGKITSQVAWVWEMSARIQELTLLRLIRLMLSVSVLAIYILSLQKDGSSVLSATDGHIVLVQARKMKMMRQYIYVHCA